VLQLALLLVASFGNRGLLAIGNGSRSVGYLSAILIESSKKRKYKILCWECFGKKLRPNKIAFLWATFFRRGDVGRFFKNLKASGKLDGRVSVIPNARAGTSRNLMKVEVLKRL
jgi:hypothetical protein